MLKFHVLGLKNEEYSPKMFFLFTRKRYLKWSKFLCNFTPWVRIETTSFLHNTPLKFYTTLATVTYKFLPWNKIDTNKNNNILNKIWYWFFYSRYSNSLAPVLRYKSKKGEMYNNSMCASKKFSTPYFRKFKALILASIFRFKIINTITLSYYLTLN